MSAWDLPESACINGSVYAIRSDYRAVLDVLKVLGDQGLDDRERGVLAFEVFYPEFDEMPANDYRAAAEYLTWFVSGGDVAAKRPKRKLADWEQDFPIIIGPVNRVLGFEARAVEHLHWWTFLGAYLEIGDCLFAQVVAIRKKKSKHRKLDKHEQEFYRDNRELVDLRRPAADLDALAEDEVLMQWLGGGNGDG